MAQTTMPEYLEKDRSSPSTATGQSEPPVPVDQSAMDNESQIDSNGSAHQLPVRQSIKSKRVIRAEKKAERKRAKLPRRCKSDAKSDIEATQLNSTPMPDDTDVSSSDDNDEQPCDLENNNLLLHDRSLTDMLRPTPSQHSDTVNVSDKESSSSVHANSQHALFIELDHIKEANRRLQNQVELLHAEMNEQQKLIKRQKGEIKRLNNENDNQRRTLSRYQGIRRFTMQATDNTKACQTDTLSDHLAASGPVISNEVCQDEIDLTRAKLNSLCDHVRQVAGSLLSVIDQDTDSNFTLVTNRKNNSQRNKRPDNLVANTESNTQAAGRQATRYCPVGAQAASATQAPPTSSLGTQAGPRRQTNAPGSQTTGRRIPVVQLGASGSVSTNVPPTYSHIVHQGKPKNRQPQFRRPSPSDTIVIGTSLTRGVGGKLHKFGVNATSYTYAGTKV